jgi:hypothetical protein
MRLPFTPGLRAARVRQTLRTVEAIVFATAILSFSPKSIVAQDPPTATEQETELSGSPSRKMTCWRGAPPPACGGFFLFEVQSEARVRGALGGPSHVLLASGFGPPPLDLLLVLVLSGARNGFLAGFLFAAGLGLLYRSRGFADLRPMGMGIIGAVAGMLLPAGAIISAVVSACPPNR